MAEKQVGLAEILAAQAFFFCTTQFGFFSNNIVIPIRYPVNTWLSIWWHAFCHINRIMNIRIDYIYDGPEIVICISGRLTGIAVEQLNKACGPIEEPFLMDLSDLLFADDKGIDAIRAIADKGVQVHGASPFIQLLLDDAP